MKNSAQKLLLYGSSPGLLEMLENIAGDLGFSVLHSGRKEEVFKVLSRQDVFTLIFITETEGNGLFDFVKQVNQAYSNLPIIPVLGQNQREKIIGLLKAGAWLCFEQPVYAEELTYYLKKMIEERFEAYNPFAVRYEERTVVIPNDFSLVMQAVKNVVYNSLPAEEKNKYQFVLGLNEIVNNAIEHGNLGISFEEKNAALKDSAFFNMASERAARQPYRSRVVTIKVKVLSSASRVEYSVHDEGDGFDWKQLPDPKTKVNVLKANGRGVMIAKKVFHDVAFNSKGNKVTLVYQSGQAGGIH
ncbi:ATP-binding protein [Fibrobacterota bacterium]